MKKGYIYTLEVIFAVSIIFIAMVFAFRSPEPKPKIETSLIKEKGLSALEFLSESGDLRKLVSSSNETGINETLRDLIPNNIDFKVKICAVQCPEVVLPENTTVIILDRYVAGSENIYTGNKLRVWLWGKL